MTTQFGRYFDDLNPSLSNYGNSQQPTRTARPQNQIRDVIYRLCCSLNLNGSFSISAGEKQLIMPIYLNGFDHHAVDRMNI